MSLCQCQERPRCQMKWCAIEASWSVRKPRWGNHPEHFIFMCEWHGQMYKKPIPGIDRPPHADEYWRPSLMDMMRLAKIAMDFEDRQRREQIINQSNFLRADDAKKYTPEQLFQVNAMRKGFAALRAERALTPHLRGISLATCRIG